MKRNDPCHCGSGKKYKRCCGNATGDLVDMIVNEELDRVLSNFFQSHSDGGEMDRTMRKWVDRLGDSWEKRDIEEASSEFYLFIQNDEGWRTYVERKFAESDRQSVKAVLREWHEPLMLLAEITDADPQVIHVQTLFDEKDYVVRRNERMPVEPGTLLFGVVLPDPRKGGNAVAPVSSMLFLAQWSKQTKRSLMELWDKFEDQPSNRFVETNALDIYELFIKRSTASLNEVVEEMLAPGQLAALVKLEETLRDLGQTGDVREMMHKLAVAYFMNESEDVSREGDFIAAAVLTGMSIGMIQGAELEKEEAIQKFDATEAGTDVYTKALDHLYANMMDSEDESVAPKLYEIGTDPRPTEKGLWETSMTTGGVVQPERKPDVAGSRAQLLAFEAYAAETEEERRELMVSAKVIDPQNPDVLLLQAEMEKDHEKAVELYEKAIRNASRTFEPGENPWQNIPNRPFMRAAFAYGIYLFNRGEYDEAASLFTDLLKMNKVDNQGARYEAIASLIHAERYKEAAEILVRYEKGSEQDATYLYLDWKLENDGGQSGNAEEMLRVAAKANPHVMHLKTFRAKPIAYPRFQEIEPGSEAEARYIWLLINRASA